MARKVETISVRLSRPNADFVRRVAKTASLSPESAIKVMLALFLIREEDEAKRLAAREAQS